MTRRDMILHEINTIPPLPHPAPLLTDWGFHNNDIFSDIVNEIEQDPILTGKIITLAQLSYFNPDQEINTLTDIYSRLGENRFFQLSLIACILNWYKAALPDNLPFPSDLTNHCVAVAVGAKALSEETQHSDIPNIFLTGFVHDIGKVAMETFLQIESETIIDHAYTNAISVNEAERNLLGIDHMEIGEIILKQWNFTSPITDVIRWHHLPESFQLDSLLIDLIHASDVIALLMGIGPESEGLNYRTSKTTETRLGLTNRIIESIIACIQTDFMDIKEYFIPPMENQHVS